MYSIPPKGSGRQQGKEHLLSNIDACQWVAEAVRTTLGPRGMDKVIVKVDGSSIISNDGATIVKNLNISNPAAKMLVEVAKAQDAEMGDGTTSVILLTVEYLKQFKGYIQDGIPPRCFIRALQKATSFAIDKVKSDSIDLGSEYKSENYRCALEKCASTALSPKLVSQQKEVFAKMVVQAVLLLDDQLPIDMIGIKKVPGGAVQDSFLVSGVAFKKTFSYPGFQMQPKKFSNPKIALLNTELELIAERENTEIRVTNVEEYQNVYDTEWKILYDKLDAICKVGAQIVLSKLSISDVATQYFSDRNIFCAGRVPDDDLQRTSKACGGTILSTINGISESDLGTCTMFEEKQVGAERYNMFTGCSNPKACTIVLRGGAMKITEENERSLHDAIMTVRRVIKNDAIVAGGGAIEMELSRTLRDYSRTMRGKEQYLISAIAHALEIIPRQLCDNAGFDPNTILNRLRRRHAEGQRHFGVDFVKENAGDTFEACVWEPAKLKINCLTAACEAASCILSVDITIKNPTNEYLKKKENL